MKRQPLPSPPRTPTAASTTEPVSAQSSPFSEFTIPAPSPLADDPQQKSPLERPESSSNPDGSSAPPTFPPRVSRAQWMMPTSGELAFLAGLPAPSVRVDDSSSDIEASKRPAGAGADADARPGQIDATNAAALASPSAPPVPDAGEILAAASRRWTGSLDGNLFHRSDTWAVGERWGRHVRVIEVERRTPDGG